MAKEKIETLAVLDYLTLLPNRSGLYSFYSGLSIQEYVTAMFLDIDNFKRVNDTYGHQVGDELLKAVTKDLQEIVPDAYIARIGGDEFVILIIGQREKHEILEVAEEICDSVERLAVSPEVRSVISLSVGVLLNEKAETTIDDVLFKSDSAMYYSKKTGKNRYTFYEQIQEEMEFKAKVESSMQQAIEDNEFKIYFKPIMNIVRSRIEAVEASIRWFRKDGEIWSPGRFLSIMEENGFVTVLERHAFERLCWMRDKYKDMECSHMPTGVNMSRKHLYRRSFVKELVDITEKYGVSPSEFVIEIAEIHAGDKEILQRTILELKKAGFGVAIDNFGAVYSSLALLATTEADMLKLDENFLGTVQDGKSRDIIIENLIKMAKGLHMNLVVEGIKTKQQEQFLAGAGCELAEGVYYAGALNQEEFNKFYEEHKEADAKVVSYHFNGNLDDENGKNSGTVSGEIGYGKGIVDSVGSLKLPGGEQMTNVVHLPKTILGNESYSVSLWVKADRLNNWTSIIMANSNIGFASLIPYGWQKLSMFRIKDTRLDESGGWYDALGEEFYAKEWTHFCATYNSVTGLSRIYQNGRLVGSVDNTLALTNHKIVVLGGDYYKPSFQGEVSELSIYNCVLMENEVKKIYDHYAKDPTFRGKKQ